MKLTPEQHAIAESSGNIKINAVAGSGKTTTLIEYAKRHKDAGRILYLAFNRSVRQSASEKFAAQGLRNVDVHTAHSLAFRRIVPHYGYKVVAGYRSREIREMLGLSGRKGDEHYGYILANHIAKLVSMFCNHAAAKVDQLDYRATVTDPKAQIFVSRNHERIVHGARLLLAKMDRKEIAVTHEFYLKKFQLSGPRLPYDIILFDEGQDASPVMLDVFMAQERATKVIVGDIFQQIYGWRHAVNAMQRVDFREYPLTTSFRFDEKIAALAMECLRWKRHLGCESDVVIRGLGTPAKVRSRATLARTNLFLLRNAINTVCEWRRFKSLYLMRSKSMPNRPRTWICRC
jgi:hypothetical protein